MWEFKAEKTDSQIYELKNLMTLRDVDEIVYWLICMKFYAGNFINIQQSFHQHTAPSCF